MAVICRQKKLLFILNPRTGSSALGEHLINEFGGEWLPKKTFFDENLSQKIDFKHNTVKELVDFGLLASDELSDYVIFTSVANPYDSLVTLYNKYRYRYDEWRKEGRQFLQSERVLKEIQYCKEHTINQWIFKNYWKAAIKSILNLDKYSVNENYLVGCNNILKKENMQSDFEKLINKHRVQGNPKIPRINKTERKGESRSDYSLLSRILIYLTYRQDFNRFKYSFFR